MNPKEYQTDALDMSSVQWIHDCGECFKPAIGLLRHTGSDRLLKDFSKKPWYIRKTYARFAIRKETKVYQLLAGVPGVPELFGSPDKNRIIYEFIPGVMLNKKKKTPVPQEFFDRLEKTLCLIHDRGVAHGDIRFKNILVTEDWKPFLIDFETAVVFSQRSNPLWKRLGLYIQKVDRRSLAKLKKKLAPDLLTPEEEKLLAEKMPLLSFARKFRKTVTRVYKKF